MKMSERRRATRLPLPKGSVSGFPTPGRILDVSSAGVKLEVDSRCVFARGELHRLVLTDLLESVEIEGLVRWTQSNWRAPQESEESEYFQTAGLAFSRLLSDQPAGIWSSLLAGMERPAAKTDSAPQSQEKPLRATAALKMIDPIPGSTVGQSSVRVVCSLEKPESITGCRINGADAILTGDLGTATVKLQRGANRIISIVSRRDGTYSTYLLGEIFRSPNH